jgi:hypothetical protein
VLSSTIHLSLLPLIIISIIIIYHPSDISIIIYHNSDIITLSGVEWDLFLYGHQLNTSYSRAVVRNNLQMLREFWPHSLLSLRTFYASIDRQGRVYNNILRLQYDQFNQVFIR